MGSLTIKQIWHLVLTIHYGPWARLAALLLLRTPIQRTSEGIFPEGSTKNVSLLSTTTFQDFRKCVQYLQSALDKGLHRNYWIYLKSNSLLNRLSCVIIIDTTDSTGFIRVRGDNGEGLDYILYPPKDEKTVNTDKSGLLFRVRWRQDNARGTSNLYSLIRTACYGPCSHL